MELICCLIVFSSIDSQLHSAKVGAADHKSWNQVLQLFFSILEFKNCQYFLYHIFAPLISWHRVSPLASINNMEVGSDQSNLKKRSGIILGPWGGNGGVSWDDGTYNGVREIKLVYDKCIDSICVVYDKNGKPVEAEKHGGVGGTKMAEINLQYPEEYLISVSGHYCPVIQGGSPVIRSLTIKSNLRTFGPYGVEEGTPFTFSIDRCQIVGFKGRSGWYLDAIGFRVSRVSTKFLQKVQKQVQRLTTSSSSKASNSASTVNAKEEL